MTSVSLPALERSWVRPNLSTSFPKIWDRFSTVDRNGQVYKIRIQDVTPELYDDVWDFYKNYYYTAEDIAVSVKDLEDDITMVSYKWIFQQCLKKKLSIIAVLDEPSSKPIIVGGLLLIVLSKDDPPAPVLPGEARAKRRNLLQKLYQGCDAFEQLKIDRYFHDYGLVVKTGYYRLGIATKLMQTVEKVGKEFKIPAIVSTFSSIASQTLVAKLGYTVLSEVRIDDYVDEKGQKILFMANTKVIQCCYYRFPIN